MSSCKPHKTQALLTALQRGVPLVRRPWAALAQTVDMTEAEVLQAARDLFERGVARRFGAVFDSRRLGYAGTLCATAVPGPDLERVAALLQPHPGVTHSYERDGSPNLWFTLTAPADRLADELRRLGETIQPYTLLNLPAVRRFKVEVILGAADPPATLSVALRAGDADPTRSAIAIGQSRGGGGPAAPRAGISTDRSVATERDGHLITDAAEGDIPPKFSEREKSLIRKIQGNLPLTEEPFSAAAQELQWDPGELLRRLAAWEQAGILRRIGFILRHRAAGFVANGMCMWRVDEADVMRAGQALAADPEVTHCYERPAAPSVPFNLYAMIHARAPAAAEAVFRRLSDRAALSGGRMLISLREFKKTSPVFFLEGQ
ncbi:MAG: hypothetical protein HY343_00165 [Lentisphaerae bacterium]|nr:hypothetical protein [Lentisphaerota bacterium]